MLWALILSRMTVVWLARFCHRRGILLKSLGYWQTQSECDLVKVDLEQNHKGFAAANFRNSRQRFETGGGERDS